MDVFVVEFDGFAFDRDRHFAVGLELGQQLAAVDFGESFLDGRDQLADPRAEAFEIGLHLVGDVLVGLLREFDRLDVQFFGDQRGVRFEPGLMCGVGQHDQNFGQRLAHLETGSHSRGAAQRGDLADHDRLLGKLPVDQRRVGRRVIAQMDAL